MSIVDLLTEENHGLLGEHFTFRPIAGKNGAYEVFVNGTSGQHIGHLSAVFNGGRLVIGGSVPETYTDAASEDLVNAIANDYKSR